MTAISAIPFYQPPSAPSARPVALSPIPMDSPRVDIPVPVCRGTIGPPRAIPAAALPRIATSAIASSLDISASPVQLTATVKALQLMAFAIASKGTNGNSTI